MVLPHAIYFETSSLWPVAHRGDDPRLQTLRKYSQALRIPLLTTNLVRDELAQKYKEECLRSKSSLQSAVEDFARRGLVEPSVIWARPLEEVLATLPETVQGHLEAYGVAVLPNLEVDQERLLSMAVRKEPPFTERGEKGFRDAVLLLTMLVHARTNNSSQIMLITNDGPIIEALLSLPEAVGLNVQVARDIATGTRMVEEFIDDLVREYEEERKGACRELALGNRDQIEEFMRQHGVFPATMFQDKLPFGESADGVEGLSLRDLQVDAVGELPRGSVEGQVRVTLTAETEVEVRVSRWSWPPVRRFRVGAEVQEDLMTAAIRRRLARGGTRRIPLSVRLEGSVHVTKQNSQETFTDLSLDAFNPPGTFLATLIEALSQADEEPPPPPPPLIAG